MVKTFIFLIIFIKPLNLMSKDIHRRIQSGLPHPPPSEDIENQLDRLNKALLCVMNEIEASSCSRNPSRLSVKDSEMFQDDRENVSFHSDENFISDELEQKVEQLLITIDRQEMIIEDYRAEELRKTEDTSIENNFSMKELSKENKELKDKLSAGNHCNHDLNRLRKEI